MTLIEIGAVASGILTVITLSGKIVKLITTIQSLINSIEQLQVDMTTTKSLWKQTTHQYETLNQRLRVVEVGLPSM